ncbi:glutaredoxin family protein [Desulfofalx alkaliphila]|uniref:glutaredoxin family protein n=1 Tax=Desulfofalx alkaliphila TaxID=105483 RepID=UPI0004E0D297|nr:hypothetical protein [Desulfofalx alkaliphila]
MVFAIYTATGCTRCKIIKAFMNSKGIAFNEYDMKAEGKEEFQKFYKESRKRIFRGPDGVEFPIIYDGAEIRQGIGACLAYLQAGTDLDGFFSVGRLHKEWVDGIHVSGGDPQYAEDFLAVLRYLKGNNMKLQIDTDGRNSGILEKIQAEALADVVIVKVLGTKEIYSGIFGPDFDSEELAKSIKLAAGFPECKFQTRVAPVKRSDGEISYITPQEVAEIAKLIEDVTGSKKNSYLLKPFDPKKAVDEQLKSVEPLAANNLFAYRTAARAHQVLTEIDKA